MSVFVLLGLGIIYTIIYLLLNFNYWDSFVTASEIEGIKQSNGYLLSTDLASYIATRLEGIFEIFLLFGPLLSVMMLAGLRSALGKQTQLLVLTKLMLLTIFVLLMAEVFWTGETARINLYIYPYLFFPVGAYLANIELSQSERKLLPTLVFAQTFLMQTFGF